MPSKVANDTAAVCDRDALRSEAKSSRVARHIAAAIKFSLRHVLVTS
jgi:hypothetical protein